MYQCFWLLYGIVFLASKTQIFLMKYINLNSAQFHSNIQKKYKFKKLFQVSILWCVHLFVRDILHLTNSSRSQNVNNKSCCICFRGDKIYSGSPPTPGVLGAAPIHWSKKKYLTKVVTYDLEMKRISHRAHNQKVPKNVSPQKSLISHLQNNCHIQGLLIIKNIYQIFC